MILRDARLLTTGKSGCEVAGVSWDRVVLAWRRQLTKLDESITVGNGVGRSSP